jgi:uncharacterized protein (DUF488 family)
LYTVGHSNHPLEVFVALLREHGIEVLADVRSRPYSKYSPHFDRERLHQALKANGVTYVFMGDELGGRPAGEEFYDLQGYVLYGRVAEAPFFLRGIERLENGAARYRVAIMCSEEDPAVCHRHLLVGRVIQGRGVTVEHIRGDGRLQPDAELDAGRAAGRQPSLFGEAEEDSWRSLRSVLPRNRPPNSSGY